MQRTLAIAQGFFVCGELGVETLWWPIDISPPAQCAGGLTDYVPMAHAMKSTCNSTSVPTCDSGFTGLIYCYGVSFIFPL